MRLQLLLLLQLHRVLTVGEPGCGWGVVCGSIVVPVAVVIGDLLDAVAPRHVAVQRCLVFDLGKHTRIMVRVGQAVWGDIKIVGPQVGHLISIS